MSDNINTLFEYWNQALQSLDPKKVAALYAEDAILLPTLSNQVRHNRTEIEQYFVDFLAKAPKGELNESNVRILKDIAINSGIYTFSFNNDDTVRARFTYVYKKYQENWLIIEHHSSLMPIS